MKRAVLNLFLITAIIGFFMYVRANDAAMSVAKVENILNRPTPTVTPTPTPKAGIPLRFIVPSLNIDTAVESVAMDSQGRMDVPKNEWNVAWYNLGFRPGEDGSAVIAGHLDTAYGPAVFANLSSLPLGGKVIIRDDRGEEHLFQVVSRNTYPNSQFPLDAVFSTAGRPVLNMITCYGVFNRAALNYSDRLVVTAELVK